MLLGTQGQEGVELKLIRLTVGSLYCSIIFEKFVFKFHELIFF